MLAALVWLGLARAGVLAFAPAGDPAPGQRAELELYLWDEPAPTQIAAREGVLLGWSGENGAYRLDYQAPAQPTRDDLLTLSLADGRALRVELPLGEPPKPRLRVPASVNAAAGPGVQVRVRVEGKNLPPPEDLAVAVGEGRVLAIEAVAGALEVLYEPLDVREPRALLLGIRDGRYPAEPPVWTTVRLSARAPIDVRTDPGTRLSVTVGGRSYGPTVAGDDGRASVTIEVRPGEITAEATLQDALGNRQSTTISLLRSPHPALVLLPEGPLVPGLRAPALYVRALDEAGKPWTEAPPVCESASGPLPVLRQIEPGTWQTELLSAAPPVGDVLVACTLGEGLVRSTARVDVVTDRATRLVLQIWPEELTGDLPVAQVRASLENARGDRLPPEGLVLSADRGVLVGFRSEEDTVYAEYHGDPTQPVDTIRALWSSSAGLGEPWSLELRAAAGEVQVRVFDRAGRPLAGFPVSLSVAGEALIATTDHNGVARAPTLASGPALVEARAGSLVRRQALLPGRTPAPVFSNLVAEREVHVRAGRVQRVVVRVEPRQIYTGGVAELRVRLEDVAGAAVTDEPVSLSAEMGELGPAEFRSDGTLVAPYTPPAGLLSEDVEIFVRSDTGAFPETTTSLELRPRPLSWSPGVSLGVISSFGRPIGPYGELRVDLAIPRLERGVLYGRVAAGYTRHRDEIQDSSRDETIALRMDVVPISFSVLARRELGLWSVWAGTGVIFTPYRIEASFEDELVLRGPGVHRPGATVYAGAARRVVGGELVAELLGLSVVSRAEDVGYEGQVGGMAILLGYRVVY